LFAVHPIHSESVAWGAGRSDVLACGLSLAGALVFLSQQQPAWRRAAIAAALVFAATLAKETAAPLLVLTPLSHIVLGRVGQGTAPPRPRAARRRGAAPAPPSRLLLYLPFAVALVLYMAAREAVLGSTLGPVSQLGTDVLAQLVGAVGHYLVKLALPVRQSAYISDLRTGPIALLATVVSVLLLAVACLGAWRHGERVVSFLLGLLQSEWVILRSECRGSACGTRGSERWRSCRNLAGFLDA